MSSKKPSFLESSVCQKCQQSAPPGHSFCAKCAPSQKDKNHRNQAPSGTPLSENDIMSCFERVLRTFGVLTQRDLDELRRDVNRLHARMEQVEAQVTRIETQLAAELRVFLQEQRKLDGRVRNLADEQQGRSNLADASNQHHLLSNDYTAARSKTYRIVDAIIEQAGPEAVPGPARCLVRAKLAHALSHVWLKEEKGVQTTSQLLEHFRNRCHAVVAQVSSIKTEHVQEVVSKILQTSPASTIAEGLLEYLNRAKQARPPIDFKVAQADEMFDARVHTPVQGCPPSGQVRFTAFPGFFVTNERYGSQAHIEVYTEEQPVLQA